MALQQQQQKRKEAKPGWLTDHIKNVVDLMTALGEKKTIKDLKL